MSDTPFAAIDGFPVQTLTLHVPGIGPWFYTASLVGDIPLTAEPKTLTIGSTFSAVGTIDADHDGSFAGDFRTRVIAGRGNWGAQLPATMYRDDSGVRASTVAQDAARAVGETLGSFTGAQPTLGTKYVRQAGTASKVLEDAAKGASWWVDFSGITHVGARPAAAIPKADSIQLLEFNPEANIATLIVDDLSQIGIGTIITDERLDGPISISAYEIHVNGDGIRVVAWCNDETQTALVDILRSIIGQATHAKLYGKYRYRVQTLEVDRVNVQAVSQSPGLPDLLSMSFAPGIPGAHARLTPGAIVFVEFIAGDRADPEITGFGGKGTNGFVPAQLILGADTEADASEAFRKGDTSDVLLPPFVAVGTIDGFGAFTAVLTASTGKTLAVASSGSSKVKIGT